MYKKKSKMKELAVVGVLTLVIISGFVLKSGEQDRQSKPDAKPNIVFLEVDDLTYKFLHCYGADFMKTPNVDKLAAEGVLFENGVSQGMMCGPSRNSLITAQYPHNFGFYLNGQLKSLPKDVWTFPKALQQQGYYTTWIGKCHIAPNEEDAIGDKTEKKTYAMKHQMGFDHVYQSAGRVVALKKAKIFRDKGKLDKVGKIDEYAGFLYEKGLLDKFIEEDGKVPTTLDENTEYMDGYFTTRAISWLQEYDGEKPYFLWLNYSCPHGPFDVPQKYHDMYDPEDMPAPIKNNLSEIPRGLKPKPDRNAGDVKKAKKRRAEYAATITYMDGQIGRMVDAIRKSPGGENTIIVFFSDHGIMMGDHGLIHKGTLYKEVTNPSLIVSYPKGFKKGERISEPVELLDLAKTVLQIAGMSDEELKGCPNGFSLMPLLTGTGKFERQGVAFGEVENFYAAVTEDYRYIDNEENPLLFDSEKDPDELDNVVNDASYKKDVKELDALTEEWKKETGPILPPEKRKKK